MMIGVKSSLTDCRMWRTGREKKCVCVCEWVSGWVSSSSAILRHYQSGRGRSNSDVKHVCIMTMSHSTNSAIIDIKSSYVRQAAWTASSASQQLRGEGGRRCRLHVLPALKRSTSLVTLLLLNIIRGAANCYCCCSWVHKGNGFQVMVLLLWFPLFAFSPPTIRPILKKKKCFSQSDIGQAWAAVLG